MKNRSTILFQTAAFLTGCFFVLSCENDEKKVSDFTRKVNMVEEGRDINSYLSQGGVMKAMLTAPVLKRYETDTVYSEFPDSLHVSFYNDSTRVETQLSALYGKYYESLNKVYLRDSVLVFNIDGDTLRCPEMWWDQSKQLIYNDTLWRLDSKNGTHLSGTVGFEATQDLKSIIFKHASGVFPYSSTDSL
mgnify:CR=1 FL=1